MAQVAKCPQCEHDLLVPDDAAAGVLAKCPACKSFFELGHADLRELPTVTLVDARVEVPLKQTAPTVSDMPPVAPQPSQMSEAQESDDVYELDDEPLELAAEGAETPEAAAERIDQWFRSAKTLDDVPPSASAPVEKIKADDITPVEMSPGSRSIDISDVHEAGGFDSEFELDQPAESSHDTAPWDDSQNMERLLAGIGSEPAHSLAAFDRKPASDMHEDHFQAEDQAETTEEWSPDASMAIRPGVEEPRRKRSIVRTMLGTVVGGVVGLALAYYALLWIKGPQMDVLEFAKYLPKAALPASFQTDAKKSTVSPPSNMISDLAAADKAVEPVTEPTTAPADKPADQPADKPAEKQASFTAPTEPVKAAAPADDRYANPAGKTEAPSHEPAALDAPPAKAITENAPSSEPVHISNAPSFTLDELATSLQAAKDARLALVTGNFSDGQEVKRAKGTSYSVMADLAQKATFVQATALPADIAKMDQQIEKLFRQTLLDAHTREEVSQITPMWIASPNRKHGGVFFAGSITHEEAKGTVIECSLDLGGGKSLTALVSPADLQKVGSSSRPVGIVGWIVDKPAERIQGYTGTAPQAVFAKELISLE